MKKIILLLAAFLATIATLSVGTFAYFSDTETSSNNVITAGDLELDLDGGDADVKVIEIVSSPIYPGQSGSSYKSLANAGSLSGELDITFGTVTSDDNGLVDDAESDVDASDGVGNGELDDYLYLAFWLDYEAGGTWGTNDRALKSDGTVITYSAPTTGTATGGTTLTVVDSAATWGVDDYAGFPVTVTGKGTAVILSNTSTTLTVATKFSSAVAASDAYSIASGPHYALASAYSGDSWDQAIVTMEKSGTAGDNWDFHIAYALPTTTGNIVMTDDVLLTITFLLEQSEAD